MKDDRKPVWKILVLIIGFFAVFGLIYAGKIRLWGPESSTSERATRADADRGNSEKDSEEDGIQGRPFPNKSKTDRARLKLSEVEDHLPVDLTKRIREDFESPIEQEKVIRSLVKLEQINVGRDQLRRGIVFLADGDYKEFEKLRKSFCGDPRNLLVKANRKSGDPEYWFSRPFEEMQEAKK